MRENIPNELKVNNHEEEVGLIKLMIDATNGKTSEVAEKLKQHKTIEEQAKALFNLITDILPYSNNPQSIRTIKSPRRIWQDIDNHQNSSDATDFAVIFSGILLNLGIKPVLRVTEYNNRGIFQHIYPIIPLNDDFYNDRTNSNHYIVLDGVKGVFDYEEPFTKFLDYTI